MEKEKSVAETLSDEAAVEAKAVTRKRYQQERAQFRALLLANPNYFGNLKVSPFKPVLSLKGNTTYEEICSVGFQPQFNRLEAVVSVKQPTGYGGDVCATGTPEFVRFYISYDTGASWQDCGLAHFMAHNIPEGTAGAKELEYVASMTINPTRHWCAQKNLARVRAILSWNVPPPPNDPDFTPVWGDVHDTHIQIEPRRWLLVKDLAAEIKLPKHLLEALDLEQTLGAGKPKSLAVSELQALYKDKGVEPHRFALTEIAKLVSQPAASESLMSAGFKGQLAELNLDLNIGDLIGQLFPSDGNTRYEELECIGLNPNQDTLAGVIRVKLPNGYNGGPCTAGSREYVAFWADTDNNGTFDTYLGTTSVTVYDTTDMPKEGLEYAVFLPVDLSKYRRPCSQGPKVMKIRAILSWNVAPSPANPNFVPVWGNREEALIHIKPGPGAQQGTHVPIIETAGSMHVDDISPVTGLANGPATLAGFTANDSPFGGEVILTGHIAYPPDISAGAAKLKYRVWVRKVGEPWQKLTNPFKIDRSQLLDGVWSALPDVTQAVDADDFYEYHEDLTGGPGNAMIFVAGNVLARWQTAGLTGLYQVRIEARNPAIPAMSWFSNSVTLRIDSAAPDCAIAITSGGGDCADFVVGDTISGTYAVSDEHFGRLTIGLLPANGGVFTPASRSYPTVPTTGESGVWSLDTTGLPRCGYVIELWAYDRTIVNSGAVGRGNRAVVGLCLRESERESA